jgi:hypothetical protein
MFPTTELSSLKPEGQKRRHPMPGREQPAEKLAGNRRVGWMLFLAFALVECRHTAVTETVVTTTVAKREISHP